MNNDIQIEYKVATTLLNDDFLNVENLQIYNPIYDKFFILNDNNYNEITLKQPYDIISIVKQFTYNSYLCLLKKNDEKVTKEVFIKFAPIVDPIKYMIGKKSKIKKRYQDFARVI